MRNSVLPQFPFEMCNFTVLDCELWPRNIDYMAYVKVHRGSYNTVKLLETNWNEFLFDSFVRLDKDYENYYHNLWC